MQIYSCINCIITDRKAKKAQRRAIPGFCYLLNRRYRTMDKIGDLEIACITCSAEDTRSIEQELLSEFELEHLELPPLNRGL